MRRTVLTILLAALSMGLWLAPDVTAQDTKMARGTITAMTAATLTVKAGEQELTFAVDPKTNVTAEGGSTAARKAAAAGKPGANLAELLKIGDPVEVRYREAGGSLRASSIRRVLSAGSGGVKPVDEDLARSDGRVDAITATSLTISGSIGGGGKFTQTFAIDTSTKVVGQGVGTAAQARGGKAPITTLISSGDQVTVSYHKTGTALHAAEIRVRVKAK